MDEDTMKWTDVDSNDTFLVVGYTSLSSSIDTAMETNLLKKKEKKKSVQHIHEFDFFLSLEMFFRFRFTFLLSVGIIQLMRL